MTPHALQDHHPENRRIERILHAALAEFGDRGFAAAREGEIARVAGVSTATIRHYFPSKEELFRDVVRSTIVTALQAAEPVQSTGSACDRLREFITWFWEMMGAPEQVALLRLSMGEMPRFPELAVFHSVEVLGRAAQRLERILVEGNTRGEFRVPDPRASARVILSALVSHAHWFAFPEIYAGLTGMDRPASEAVIADVLLEIVCAPPPPRGKD
jgi:AcrR family transcriptional regulator